eukprot:177655_1
MSASVVFPFAVYFLFHLATIHATTDCHDYFECESQTLTDLTNCYGFGSCYASSISTDNPIHCDGAHSCHAASIDSDESVFCRSIASCSGATLKSVSKLYCEGIASCSNADIETGGTVYSYGHYGTTGSTIYGASTVRGYGYYSLLYATVDSANVEKMSVKLFGVDAGYGANIVCQSGSTCTLTCKGGGCGETDFICLYGASCSVSPEECLSDNSVQEYESVSCPQWKISNSANDDEDFTEYMKQKESEKEDNIKWKLFETYTAEDMDSFDALIEQRQEDKILDGKVILDVHGTNVYSYLVGTIISFVLIALICAIKRCNDQYLKLT